ncbi:MAG TPA: lycopene cyclase family protein [Egibacteraceae bacterium]|nr:lycopene cyclase family protein [Egibacteraceae bacterium]
MQPVVDVVVVGSGPAGLSAAAACAETGMAVSVLAEDHERPWPQTLGVWTDEIEGLELGATVAARWPEVVVHLGEATARRLPRSYGRFDNDRLRDALRTRALAAGARLVRGRAAAVEDAPAGPTVRTSQGVALRCRVVVDASGHRPALLASGPAPAGAYQAAYGLVGRFRPALSAQGMVLMDYRDPPGDARDPAPAHPTFLYAMPLGDGWELAEETSLARRPAMDIGALEGRLARRLAGMGVRVERRVGEERVLIPMGVPVPARDRRVVGFGAAAGMVHPATGYQVGAALARAPVLAAALAGALGRTGAATEAVAVAGWNAVWPRDRLRQRALHVLGLESLLCLDRDATRGFFRAFFDLPVSRWGGFLSGEASARALARTMLTLFAGSPAGVRGTLASTAVRHPALLRDAARGRPPALSPPAEERQAGGRPSCPDR